MPYNPAPVPIELAPDELAFVDDLALRISSWRRNVGSRHRNNLAAPTFARRLEMSMMGTRSEGVLFKAFGGHDAGAQWDTSVGAAKAYDQTPDIVFQGVEYDAKGINLDGYSLVCIHDRKLPLGGVHPTWRYVLVGLQHCPRCRLIGWALGTDVLRYRPEDRNHDDRPAHYLPGRELRDVRSLPLCRATESVEQFSLFSPSPGQRRSPVR
jgi:hypothetical protein